MPNAVKRSLKVFLCHASGDKPAIRDLYKRLVMEGVDAWLDQEKLLPGQDWRVEIPRAVREADVVVVCLSKNSITKEGYIQKEIKFALDIAEEKPEGTIFLIPARLEDCIAPETLNRWQWVDLFDENGFIKLLRSLKLRADAVGAKVEPIAYVDSDKERERRLEQLYTEGLAAFYTEDWDKACQRFQTILSEQPDHSNAIEKLEEADRQRKLEKLYEQATGAVRAEDWGAAIQTLEELSQKSADYKDTLQLLRNARKQKQLKGLNAEARTLHAAQKWEAVVKIFGQISSIDPNYPDTEGLLPSAQKEVAELKRLANLNDLYSHAVREMEAGQWQEARRLLELVHKSQTGFLETEKLLRKVENEILREEEKRKQSDQINTLYEQAHGLLRSQKWRNALDKLEQIRRLDEHFLDLDGIADKAQKELAREEQEAERQDQLAALYAEAVRLLKDEKYQEALDKWQEVKAIDPEYPDRQWVQRTVKRKLAETAKPSRVKPRIEISRRLLFGITGVITIVALILGGFILLKFLPDPTMYDDFVKSDYDGAFDPSKWTYWRHDIDGSMYQENGVLVFFQRGTKDRWQFLQATSLDYYPLTSAYFEIVLRLDPDAKGGEVQLRFYDNYGLAVCGVSGPEFQAYCWCNSGGNDLFDKRISVQIDSWHSFRIEAVPSKADFTFYIDGQNIGSCSLPTPTGSLESTANFDVGGKLASDSVKGYIDYVRIGPLE